MKRSRQTYKRNTTLYSSEDVKYRYIFIFQRVNLPEKETYILHGKIKLWGYGRCQIAVCFLRQPFLPPPPHTQKLGHAAWQQPPGISQRGNTQLSPAKCPVCCYQLLAGQGGSWLAKTCQHWHIQKPWEENKIMSMLAMKKRQKKAVKSDCLGLSVLENRESG